MARHVKKTGGQIWKKKMLHCYSYRRDTV